MQFTRMLAGEVDGFFSATPANILAFPDGHEETRQIRAFAAVAEVQVGMPLPQANGFLRPRVGAGFGLMNLHQFSGTPSGDGDQVVQVAGFFLSGGLDVQLGSVFVFADLSSGEGLNMVCMFFCPGITTSAVASRSSSVTFVGLESLFFIFQGF